MITDRTKQFYTKGGRLIDMTDWNTDGCCNVLGDKYGWEGTMAWGNLIHDELNGAGPGVKSGDIFLDLGANIGLSSINAELKGASKIYSVEPDKGVYDALLMNKGENWETFNIGISDKNEYVKINNWPNNKKKTPCECVTLDSFLEDNSIDRVDYMKVDIETHEKTAFKNTRRESWDKINKIFVEWHEDHSLSLFGRSMERNSFAHSFYKNGFPYYSVIYGEYQSFIYVWK